MTASAARLERLSIRGPAGPIEAVAERADGVPRASYAVICHPHPLHGGTQDNKVVTSLARALQGVGIATLRFNFRGVGASAGEFDGGRGETDDADAVAAYGAVRWPDCDLVLAGFSFGAFVALKLSLKRDTARLITVAPPVGRFDFSGIPAPKCPWLIVQGDADDVVDPQAVLGWARGLEPQPTLTVAHGVGHFFHGHLAELREAVSEAVRSG